MIKIIGGIDGSHDSFEVNKIAIEANFGAPYGLARSRSGDVYFASMNHHVVLKIDHTTSIVTIVAGTRTGTKGDDNILATNSPLSSPTSVAVIEDSSGKVTDVIICEKGSHRVRKVNVKSGYINTIVGTGTQGYSGDGSPAVGAQLAEPRHVYYDKSIGDLFITDTGNSRIRRVFGSSGKITTVVGGKACSSTVNYGDGGKATDACLSRPSDFTMNAVGEWFIADTWNDRIRKVDSNGIITTVAGGGESIDDGQATMVLVDKPEGVAVLLSGELLIADLSHSRIRRVDRNGYMEVIAGGGDTISSSAIPALTTSVSPTHILYTPGFGILVGDNVGKILKLYKESECFGVSNHLDTVCSGHGDCVDLDQCQCKDEWFNNDCSVTHCFGVTSNIPDVVCSGRGQCIRHNECECNDGFRGHKCQRPPKKITPDKTKRRTNKQ